MKPINTKLQKLNQLKLSETERDFMWLQIQSRKDFVANELVDQPVSSVFYIAKRLALAFSPVMAGFLLMFGSASALPGQQLYSFKTSVNEPLERLVTVGGGTEIEFETKLLHRRVNEARTLKAMGLLDVDTASKIENTITKQANKVVEKSDKKIKAEGAEIELDLPDDSKSDDEIETNVALAEYKGVAQGSAIAVMIMAGKDVVETEDKEIAEKIEEAPNQEFKSSSKSATTNQKMSLTDKVEADPEVLKTKIQAEAKVATTKAEVAKEISGASSADASAVVKIDTSEAGIANTKIKQDVEEVTQKKINLAKEVVDKNITEVDEEDLLGALEQASAARTISEAFNE